MKTKVHLNFAIYNVEGGVRAVLDMARCGTDVAQYERAGTIVREYAKIVLDESDPRLAHLFRILKSHNEDWHEWRWDEYTDEELSAAPLLVMTSSDDNEVFGGPRVGVTFDMSQACPNCGAGAIQTSAMIVDSDAQPEFERSRAVPTGYNDILVDNALADELRALGATGFFFRDVYIKTENEGTKQLPWKQLCASHTMPPMRPETTGIEPIEHGCTTCKRSGLSRPRAQPFRLTYHRADLEHIKDVNVTWEWFGPAKYKGDVSQALFPYPLHLVTPRIMQVFKKPDIIGFRFIPVRVLED